MARKQLQTHTTNQTQGATLVWRYALQAAVAAAGSFAILVPLRVIADLVGFDPVRSVQQRMIDTMSSHPGRDLRTELRRMCKPPEADGS